MAKAIKQVQTRGFIVPDPKLAIGARDLTDADLATATQGDGLPGVPVAATPSLMALSAGGEVWSGDTLGVQVLKGGQATPGPSAARVSWTGGTTEGSTARGWLPYNVMSGFFYLATSATNLSGSVGVTTSKPVVLRRSNGDVVTAVVSDYSGAVTIAVLLYDASVGKFRPSYARYDAGLPGYVYDNRSAYTWVDEVVTTTDTGTDPTNPCLLELETGRLLLFFTSTQSYAGGTSYFAVGYSYSDDGGATWTFAARDVGARIVASGDPILHLQAVYTNGYITLLIVYGASSSAAFLHYVSADDGASFTSVDSSFSDIPISAQLIGCDDGSVVMFYIDGGSGVLKIARKYEHYGLFLDQTAIAPSGGGLLIGFREAPDCLAATLLEDRTIGLIAVTDDNGTYAPGLRFMRFYQDISTAVDSIKIPYYGNTFEADAAEYGAGTGATQHIPSARSVCVFGSQLLLVYDTTEATSYSGAQLFGGYSSIDWNGPTFGISSEVAANTRYGVWWNAGHKPSTLPIWTVNGTGTEGSSVERLLSYDFSGGADTKYNARNGLAGADVWVWMRVRVDSGGSLTTAAVGAILQSANGTNDYQVEVRLTTTGIRLYDTWGAATKGTDATLSTASEMIDVLCSLTSTGRCVVWYKSAYSTVWIQGPYGNATLKGASPAAVSRVTWGNITSSTSKSTWADVGSACDGWYGSLPVSVSEPTQPRITFGREVSIWPVFVADGATIFGAGIATRGESWTIAPKFTYPTDNLDPLLNPAPSLVWHSADDQAEQILGWDLGAEDGPDSALAGLYAQGVNFPLLYVEQDDGIGGWTRLVDISTIVISGAFTRVGFRVKPDITDVTGSRSVGRDELAGTWIILNDGGDLYYVKVKKNSQGTWNVSEGVLSIILTLDATVAELSALPTSGTIQIIAPEIACVFGLPSEPRQQWRIRIPARTYVSAPEAYHQASVLMIGPYLAVGWDWANARTVAMEPLQTIAETETGKRAVTSLSTRGRRVVEVVWTDMIPGVDVLGDTAVPQAVAGSYSSTDPDEKGVPLAHQADPRQVEDLLLRTQGALYPVVLLPRVPLIAYRDDGGSTTIYGRDNLLYGQILNGSTRTEPVSNEDVVEITTISSMVISENKG